MRALLVVAAGLVWSLAAGPAMAQPSTTHVRWEPLGLARGGVIAFAPKRDDVNKYNEYIYVYGYMSSGQYFNSGIYVLYPDSSEWSSDVYVSVPGDDVTSGYVMSMLITATGTLLTGSAAGPTKLDRRAPGQPRWTRQDVPGYVSSLYERPSDGALIAGMHIPGGNVLTTPPPSDPCPVYPACIRPGLIISTDDGVTWGPLGTPAGGEPGRVFALIETPPRVPGGRPRMASAGYNGLAYSDDGGRTWTKSTVWQGFRYIGYDLVAAPSEGPAGRAAGAPDVLFAHAWDLVEDVELVLASDDGGATWAERYRERIEGGLEIVAGLDGALAMAYDEPLTMGAPPVTRSLDGGRTWAAISDGYDGAILSDIAVDSQGRLVLGTESGVWRTTAPVMATAGEAAPATAERLGVAVRPNPAGGRVEVVLRAAAAGTARVAVVDVRGREVAVVLDGAVLAGETVRALETSGWPAGVYVVRASVGRETATARLVVAR